MDISIYSQRLYEREKIKMYAVLLDFAEIKQEVLPEYPVLNL